MSSLPLLDVQRVSMSFGGVHALDEISMRVTAGTIHGLIGPNGAGKTTLINVLSGFYRSAKGQILLNGVRIDGLKPYQVSRAGIARTFQNIRLFPALSAKENVLVAFREGTPRRALARLLFLPVARSIERREGDIALRHLARLGVDGRSRRPAGTLSYGDQRRVEIARALATDPRLLVLDEPAAGMNRAETDALRDALRALVEPNRSILLIDHDLPLVMSICDEITVLNFGRVIAVGSPATIAADNAVIEAYLGREDDVAPL